MKRALLVVWVLQCSVCCLLHSQGLMFRAITVEQGLPENQVRSIRQFGDGRMCVLTEGLLTIYDGAKFRTFHTHNDNLLNIRTVGDSRLFIARDGNVWVRRIGSLAIFNPRTEKFFDNPAEYIRDSLHYEGKIESVFVDETGEVWVYSVHRTGNSRSGAGSLHALFGDITLQVSVPPYDLSRSGDNEFVFTTDGKTLCYSIIDEQRLYEMPAFPDYQQSANTNFRALPAQGGFFFIYRDDRGESRFMRFDQITRTYNTLMTSPERFVSLTRLPGGNVALMSNPSLFIFSPDGTLIKHYNSLPGEGTATPEHNKKLDMIVDRDAALWVVCMNRGLLYYSPETVAFSSIESPDDIATQTTCMLQLDEDNVLLGTENGLYNYNTRTNQRTLYSSQTASGHYLQLFRDPDGEIYVSLLYMGIMKVNTASRRLESVSLISAATQQPSNLSIRYMYYMKGVGHLLLEHDEGAGILSMDKGTFTPLAVRFPELRRLGLLTHVVKWSNSAVLLASQAGVVIYDFRKDKIWFPDFEHDNIKYNHVYRDRRGWVWFGTQDGLYLYQPASKRKYAYHTTDGLVNNSIQTITEDQDGLLIVATSAGISYLHIDPKAEDPVSSFQNFTSRDGLLHGEYCERSTLTLPDGRILLGGVTGFTIMPPHLNKDINRTIPPVLSSIYINSKELTAGDETGILTAAAAYTDRINLSHNQNTLTLNFSAPDFANSAQIRFRYSLSTDDNEVWIERISDNGGLQLSLYSLAVGTYHLRVHAVVGNGEWSGEPLLLTIVVRPPLLLSLPFILLYIVLVIAIIFVAVRTMVRRRRLRYMHLLEMERLQQSEQLNNMKFRFFTNISHEFRTPLTLILTPLESMIAGETDSAMRTRLANIHRQAQELLQLVNQLLDFRRLEMKGEQLYLQYGDIVEFISNHVVSFETLAQEQHKNWVLQIPEESIFTNFDKDKLRKIINNLLSNAFKFTKECDSITVSIAYADDILTIMVKDTGCGISEADKEKIFDRFYQSPRNDDSTTGTGIGLHLTRQYVELMNGEMDIESTVGKGSVFTLRLPFVAEAHTYDSPLPVERSQKPALQSTILLVEDNKEFRIFMSEQLSRHYNVLQAENGETGLAQAEQHNPDLIISDVMMPIMDGNELCRHIKSNIATSHIPIILLTAHSTEQARVSGYEAGADSYIEKPFNMSMLLMRISNLLSNRQKRLEYYHESLDIKPAELTITHTDEDFLQRLLDDINKHLDDENYSIENMSDVMNMSRSTLYRKLANLTGESPSSFLRTIRMKRAASLLLTRQFTVQEVAYQVGFLNAKYFTRCFKEQFGCPPSNYQERHN